MSSSNNTSQLFSVKDKVAVVTGATGALGKVVAKTLADAGCNLVMAGSNTDALDALEKALETSEAKIATVYRRPESSKDCDLIISTAVECFGRLDILVVASGKNDVDPIETMSVDRWQSVMDANVKGSWMMCQSAGKQFIKQAESMGDAVTDSGRQVSNGKVVLISSARGKLGHPAGYSAYCTSKSAVDGMTRALGCEWGKYKVNVNAIAPTVFRSDLTAWMFAEGEQATKTREQMLSRIPMGRLGEPEDLVGPLLFLVSQASDFYTGHILYADGGYTAG